MVIKKRDFSNIEINKEPEKEPEGVLKYFEGRQKLNAGRSIYAKTNPIDIPLEDSLELVQFADWPDNVEAVYRNRVKNRATGIRAFCVLCKGGSPKSVRYCTYCNCPLWNYRLGSNPLRKSKPSSS